MTIMEKANPKPPKAYKNLDFLNSRAARQIRIMCEYEETGHRLKSNDVGGSILVFGSARSYSQEGWEERNQTLKQQLESTNDAAAKEKLQAAYDRHQKLAWVIPYYNKTRELSYLLTKWAMAPENREVVCKLLNKVNPELDFTDLDFTERCPLLIATGGGPGLMEAANKGAADVENGRSMGMGISLPFENSLNRYITKELSFEFHYFFTRKFWMIYYCLAVIATPGGVGTLDELFEIMTLRQTGKVKHEVPIVLLGTEYWKDLINMDLMVERGVVAPQDKEQLFYTDSPQEAFEYVVKKFTKIANTP